MSSSINSETTVIYQTVIDEVITNIREAFLDEGYDEILLQELKSLWETKLSQSRALAQTTNEDTSTAAAAATSSASNDNNNHHHQQHQQQQQQQARQHHQHHHQHQQQQQHHGQMAAANTHHNYQTGGGMRLPITPSSTSTTTSAKVVHQVIARNADSLAAAQAAAAVAAASSRTQTPSPGPVDIKPSILNMMDSATRAAFQALPQHHLYATAHQAIHQHQQQQQLQHQQHQPQTQAHAQQHKKSSTHPLAGTQLDGHSAGPHAAAAASSGGVGGGGGGSSSEDEDDDLGAVGSAHDDDDDDNVVDDEDEKATANNDDPSEYEGKEDPDPLNSGDDLTEPGTPDSNSDLFDTDNVIVCQYDKITRIKNKWKFHLKDGIMNINGKDYLFSKANGDAEW